MANYVVCSVCANSFDASQVSPGGVNKCPSCRQLDVAANKLKTEASALAKEAREFFKSGQYPLALTLAERALKLDPANYHATHIISLLKFVNDDFKASFEYASFTIKNIIGGLSSRSQQQVLEDSKETQSALRILFFSFSLLEDIIDRMKEVEEYQGLQPLNDCIGTLPELLSGMGVASQQAAEREAIKQTFKCLKVVNTNSLLSPKTKVRIKDIFKQHFQRWLDIECARTRGLRASLKPSRGNLFALIKAPLPGLLTAILVWFWVIILDLDDMSFWVGFIVLGGLASFVVGVIPFMSGLGHYVASKNSQPLNQGFQKASDYLHTTKKKAVKLGVLDDSYIIDLSKKEKPVAQKQPGPPKRRRKVIIGLLVMGLICAAYALYYIYLSPSVTVPDPTEAPIQVEKDKSFSIQIASRATQTEGLNLCAKLPSPCRVIPQQANGKFRFLVFVGQFNSQSEAASYLDTLKKEHSKAGNQHVIRQDIIRAFIVDMKGFDKPGKNGFKIQATWSLKMAHSKYTAFMKQNKNQLTGYLLDEAGHHFPLTSGKIEQIGEEEKWVFYFTEGANQWSGIISKSENGFIIQHGTFDTNLPKPLRKKFNGTINIESN